MAFALRLDRPMQDNLQRVADEQLKKAIRELESQGDAAQLARNIHQVRKRMKMLRGLLRLMRGELPKSVYRDENACFRDTARLLAGARDAQVLVDTYDTLIASCDSSDEKLALAPLRELLEQERQTMLHVDGTTDKRMREAAATLRSARQRVPGWQLRKPGFGALAAGLQQTYGSGRRAFAGAYDTWQDSDFHEWRKAVKYHWYHSRLLERLWPPVLKVRVDTLKELSELLGDDHDLAVLRNALSTHEQITVEQRMTLERLAKARQEVLRTRARQLGQLLYADLPKPLRKRFKAYWHAQAASA